MKSRVLTYLKESRDYISGQELSNIFGVSRTAIWKAVKGLKEDGYDIKSVRNKGYKLISIPDILLADEIKYGLKTNYIGDNVIIYDAIDSTNQQAKRLALDGLGNGTVVIAEQQIKGKGRRGKNWESPYQTGIWMSILLKPNIHPNQASMITLLAGLATVKSINKKIDNNSFIKWPNDIVINGKKVCGILTEISTEIDTVNYIIVGIGINVNTLEFDKDIKDIATSIAREEGQKVDRVPIIQSILQNFEYYYDIFKRDLNLSNIIKEYEKECININKEVKVIYKNKEIEGKAMGITPIGELVIIDKSGQKHTVNSGEVSVRGLNGYI
ncbi:MAG: biotin--[acetyl-CoA-carboxylase] ligase [Eubacteriales bacterium]